MLHVGKSINETIRQQARLQVLRLEYIREFGRQPPGGCVATDSEWIKDQLDHADEVKRQTRLCQLYAAFMGTSCAMWTISMISDVCR